MTIERIARKYKNFKDKYDKRKGSLDFRLKEEDETRN